MRPAVFHNVIAGRVLPPAPTGLTVTQTDTGPQLAWTSAAASFKIYANGVEVGTDTASPYIYTSATSGASVSYTVTAIVGGVESLPSSAVVFTWWKPVEDSFTYTDTDITGATPDVINNGNTWTSIQLGGGASRLNTNGTVVYNGSSTGSPAAHIGVGSPDGKITYSGALRNNVAGSIQTRGILRFVDTDRMWLAVWSRNTSGGTMTLYEADVIAAVPTYTDKGSYVAGTTHDTVVFESDSSDNFTVKIGGTLRIGPVTDTTHNTATSAGIGVTDSGSTAASTNVANWRWEPV